MSGKSLRKCTLSEKFLLESYFINKLTSVIVEGLSFSGVELGGKDLHSPSSSSMSSMSSGSFPVSFKSIPSTMANLAMFVAVTSLN